MTLDDLTATSIRSQPAPVLIWIATASKEWSFVNQAWLALTGRPIDALLGSGWTDHVHAEDRAACYDVYARAFDRREPFQMEFRVRRHDGEWRWIVSSGVPMFHADGSFAGYMGSALDVTERKLAAETLACVPRRLIDAQEEERSRIARELHDDYSQRLAMVVFNLDECMGAGAELSSGFRQQLKTARDEVMSLAKDVQALSDRLHPARVELLGISSAAAALCRDIARQRGVSIIFSAERVFEDVPRRVAICLYRVLQEALQNAVKHSGAATIAVSLGGDADAIEMTIRDHGEGFDVAGAQGRGLGLVSMRERLKAVHGRLVILSEPHHGTTISVSVPLLQECLR